MIPYQTYFVVLGLYHFFSLAAWSHVCVCCLDHFRLVFNGAEWMDHDALPLYYIACNATDHGLDVHGSVQRNINLIERTNKM